MTVPAAAVRSNAEIRVSPQVATPAWARWAAYDVHPIIITPIVGSVSVATDFGNETDLNMLEGATHQLTLSLDGDAWVDTVGDAGSDLNVAIVRGLTSSSDEVSGWNRVVQNALAFLAATQSGHARLGVGRVDRRALHLRLRHHARRRRVGHRPRRRAGDEHDDHRRVVRRDAVAVGLHTLEFGGVAETPNAAGLRTSCSSSASA